MNNITRYPQCHMRTSFGNCDPIGGFCLSVNESVCEALHKVSRLQGKWVDDGDTLICSNCKTAYNHPIFYNGWNYCPNCGARMKGTNNEY